MPAPEYGRRLRGLGVNLIVRDILAALSFQSEVLAAEILHNDLDFAAMQAFGAEWMLHADHTYNNNSVNGILNNRPARGIGVELRLYGRNPDDAEAKARALAGI